MSDATELTAGGGIFSKLKMLGVDYVFCNSGTDFPPIIEGLAQAARDGISLPHALVIPHEHAAIGMAHGYYLLSGRCQAVMLHTNVGLSNGATAAINAACDHIPVLLMSGRTPVMEHTRLGARTVPIGWGQEMRDQTALVRESCKWDYELKFPEQIGPLLDRAWAIANSTPKGPAYLSLPREVLCEPIDASSLDDAGATATVRVAPDGQALQLAANALASARNPLIIAQRGVGDAETFAAFAAFVQHWAIPVCSYWAVQLALDTDHPCHIGAEPDVWLEHADVVVVLDCLAPWWPDRHTLNKNATVINIGPNPIFSRFPVRTFRADISLVGESSDTVKLLIEQMQQQPRPADLIEQRLERIARYSQHGRSSMPEQASQTGPITKPWVSLCLGQALSGRVSTVFSELGTQLGTLSRSGHNSWFQEPHSGGLGWSFPAALGALLAEPDRLVVATMGDGSYMFANPTVCHQIAEALALPILVIVLNNGEWGAVRQSVQGLYPDGAAVDTNRMPLTSLGPSPDFTLTAAASRARVERVSEREQLPSALNRAIEIVSRERCQVLLDVQIE